MLLPTLPNEGKTTARVGGVETQALNLTKYMSQDARFLVSVITRKINAVPDRIPGVRVHRVSATLSPLLSRVLFFLKGLQEFRKLHRVHPVDVIFVHRIDTHLLLAWVLKKLYGVKIYIKIETYEVDLLARPGFRAYLHLLRPLLFTCDKIQILNRTIGLKGLRLGIPKKKMVFLPNGIDPHDFPFQEPDLGQIFTISYIGRLSNEKKLPVFLKALEILKARKFSFQARIIGNGPLEDRLHRLREALDLQSHLEFLPFQKNILPYYHEATITVLPSEFEGISCMALESLSTGTPLVATNIQGNDEVVADGVTGFLIPVKDPEALAEKIIYLMENPPEVRRMARAGRQRIVAKFSYEIIVNQLYQTFTSIISDRQTEEAS